MTYQFPLFRLPYVAYRNVLDHVGPQILFTISLCSANSRFIIKSYNGPSKSYELVMDFGFSDSVICRNGRKFFFLIRIKETPSNRNEEPQETVEIGNFTIPVYFNLLPENCLISYWTDRIVGLTELGNYVREIFKRDISRLNLGRQVREDDHKRAVDWINSHQKSIGFIYCNLKSDHHSNFDYCLKSFRATKQVFFLCRPDNPSINSNWNLKCCEVEDFYIDSSSWVNRKMLLRLNSKRITLVGSQLTSNDINAFLHQWSNGQCSRLKEFHIILKTGQFDFQTALEGLQHVEMDLHEVTEVFDYHNKSHSFHSGVHLKRRLDGVKATIHNMNNTKRFWLIFH